MINTKFYYDWSYFQRRDKNLDWFDFFSKRGTISIQWRVFSVAKYFKINSISFLALFLWRIWRIFESKLFELYDVVDKMNYTVPNDSVY